MIEDFYITPKPKLLKISKNNGIRLSNLLTIYLNKHRIKDTALQVSSRFNKHFNVFLKTLPIKDSYIDKAIGNLNYFACITSESHYDNNIKMHINSIIKQILEGWGLALSDYTQSYQKENFIKASSDNVVEKEGYYINIQSEIIWLVSKTETGFYNGIQTLIQVIDNATFRHEENENFIIVPELSVIDFPINKTRFLYLDVPIVNSKNKFEFIENFIPFAGKLKLNEFSVSVKETLVETLNVKAQPYKLIVNTKSTLPNVIKMISIGVKNSGLASYFQSFVNSELFWNFNENDNPLDSIDWDYLSKSVVTNLFEANCEVIDLDVQKLWDLTSKNNVDFIETQLRNLIGNIFANEEIISDILKFLARKKIEFK